MNAQQLIDSTPEPFNWKVFWRAFDKELEAEMKKGEWKKWKTINHK